MLEIGEQAPDFELPDQDGNPVRLSDLRGQPIVLYFYPRADTPGCTTQACGSATTAPTTRPPGPACSASPPTRSRRSPSSTTKYDLGFTLLADADHAVADAYGTWIEKSMYGKKYMGVQRATFVIDPDGRSRRSSRRRQPKTHDDLVLGAAARSA